MSKTLRKNSRISNSNPRIYVTPEPPITAPQSALAQDTSSLHSKKNGMIRVQPGQKDPATKNHVVHGQHRHTRSNSLEENAKVDESTTASQIKDSKTAPGTVVAVPDHGHRDHRSIPSDSSKATRQSAETQTVNQPVQGKSPRKPHAATEPYRPPTLFPQANSPMTSTQNHNISGAQLSGQKQKALEIRETLVRDKVKETHAQGQTDTGATLRHDSLTAHPSAAHKAKKSVRLDLSADDEEQDRSPSSLTQIFDPPPAAERVEEFPNFDDFSDTASFSVYTAPHLPQNALIRRQPSEDSLSSLSSLSSMSTAPRQSDLKAKRMPPPTTLKHLDSASGPSQISRSASPASQQEEQMPPNIAKLMQSPTDSRTQSLTSNMPHRNPSIESLNLGSKSAVSLQPSLLDKLQASIYALSQPPEPLLAFDAMPTSSSVSPLYPPDIPSSKSRGTTTDYATSKDGRGEMAWEKNRKPSPRVHDMQAFGGSLGRNAGNKLVKGKKRFGINWG